MLLSFYTCIAVVWKCHVQLSVLVLFHSVLFTCPWTSLKKGNHNSIFAVQTGEGHLSGLRGQMSGKKGCLSGKKVDILAKWKITLLSRLPVYLWIDALLLARTKIAQFIYELTFVRCPLLIMGRLKFGFGASPGNMACFQSSIQPISVPIPDYTF